MTGLGGGQALGDAANDRPEPGFERVIEIDDAASGLRAVLALHSTRAGPAFGGIRRRAYASLAEARSDALALAHAMSRKCALAGLPAGGGKTAIIDAPGLDLAAVYARLGELVEGLEGRYVCGPDVGTSDAWLDVVRAQTRHVNPAGNDAGASTAAGVLAATRATLLHARGSAELSGLRVGVEGLGAVGGALARSLAGAGASVWGADPDAAARDRAVASAPVGRVQVFEHSEALDVLGARSLDLLMPCALGGSLTLGRVQGELPAMVCGSANNQLAAAEVDAALHAAGVLWAPDVAVSAGAVIEGVHTYGQAQSAGAGSARRAVARGIAGIADTLAELFARAQAQGQPTGSVADAMADERLR